jgi:ABC-type transport system involved in multi-copper enzyme maturation permease subunit
MTAVAADHAVAAGEARRAAERAPRGPSRAVARALSGWLWNPVVGKELRARMHGWHAAVVVTGYLCVVGAVGYLGYSGIESSASDVVQVGGAGSTLFTGLAAAAMAGAALLVPGIVAPSIAGERERETLELLLTTPLRPARIVLGKLLAALAFVVVLVLACLPLFAVAYLLGGVGVSEVLEFAAFIVVGTACVGALSMLASVALRRVTPATVVAYLAMLVLAAGPFVGAYAWQAAASPGQPVVTGNGGQGTLEAVSPVMGADALINSNSTCGTGGLVTPFVGNLAPPVVNTCGGPGDYVTSMGPLGNWQTWVSTLAFNGAIALAATGASVLVFRKKAFA